MRMFRALLVPLRALFRQREVDREMDAELRFHLDMQTAMHERDGASAEAARRQARLEFGGVERFREEGREARGGGVLSDLRRDAVYALRGARRSPGYTATIVLTLALGIGATTAIFSVIRDVLLRDLPFAEPRQLVRVWVADPSRDESHGPLSIPDFADWRTLNSSLSELAAYSTLPTGLALIDGGEPVRLNTAFVSPSFFSTLGIGAAVGRVILPDEHEPGRERVVMLSHRLWQSRFGGDSSVVGRTLRLDDAPFMVTGVLPPGVWFPARDIDLWTPLEVVPESGIPRVRGVRWLSLVGRLRPGVTPEGARADLAAVAARLATEYGDSNDGWTSATVLPLRDDIIGESRSRLLVILGAVALVLILACTNIANLVLARSWRRRREMALRTALGASRERLVRQLLVENLLFALMGGALGLALAFAGTGALAARADSWLPSSGNVRPDALVLAVGLLLSVVCGIGFGLVPALQRLRDVEPELREGGRGNSGSGETQFLRRALVAAEVALAVMLVTGAALLARSFAQLNRVDLGFEADRVAYAQVTIPGSRFPTSETYLPQAARMLERVQAIPGVTSAAAVKDAPLIAFGEQMGFEIPGRAADPSGNGPLAHLLPVSTGFFRTMGIPLLAGSDLSRTDGPDAAREVIISETTASRYWPGASPIGEDITFGEMPLRIVGIVNDVRYATVDVESDPAIYMPNGLMRRRIFTFVARAGAGQDPAMLVPAMRDAIRSVDADQAFSRIGTMRDVVAGELAAPRFLTLLVGMFGALALLLAAIGVYGVVAFTVGERTNEIGIRMALGARPGDVAAWTLRNGMLPVVMGVLVGVMAALALSRTLRSQLYEVSARDPVVFASVVAVLLAVSLLAAGLPAMRAARLAPTRALRGE